MKTDTFDNLAMPHNLRTGTARNSEVLSGEAA
jgi:hypothetical protein